eukprot:5897547-Prymnesium_polylepis.1
MPRVASEGTEGCCTHAGGMRGAKRRAPMGLQSHSGVRPARTRGARPLKRRLRPRRSYRAEARATCRGAGPRRGAVAARCACIRG